MSLLLRGSRNTTPYSSHYRLIPSNSPAGWQSNIYRELTTHVLQQAPNFAPTAASMDYAARTIVPNVPTAPFPSQSSFTLQRLLPLLLLDHNKVKL